MITDEAVQSSHADSGPLEVAVRVARTIEQIEEIREVWTSWKGPRDSDIDFYLEFIHSHPEVLRPHVVVLYRNGQPDAMLIGRLERTEHSSRIGYFRLPGMSAQTLNFVYGALRGDGSDENSRELIGSVMQSLRSGEADVAFLHQPSTDSFLYKAALSLPGFGFRDRLSKAETHHIIKVPDTAEELYRGFSRGLREELRRKKKKLTKDFEGRVTVRCYRDPSELTIALPAIEEVAKKTYQRGLGVGFLDTPEIRRRMEFCAQKGWLRIHVLYIDDQPRSFWSGTVRDGVFTSDYNAYDPAFRDYSLGSVIIGTVLEDCCGEGVKEIDWGFGQAEYKERFGNHRLTESSVYIFAPRIKGFTLNATRTASGLIDNALRKTLERTQLLPRVKRLWRKRAAHSAQPSGGSAEN